MTVYNSLVKKEEYVHKVVRTIFESLTTANFLPAKSRETVPGQFQKIYDSFLTWSSLISRFSQSLEKIPISGTEYTPVTPTTLTFTYCCLVVVTTLH